jgi:hypothetical protein
VEWTGGAHRAGRSFHVATLDYDKDEIEVRTVEFVTGVLATAGA